MIHFVKFITVQNVQISKILKKLILFSKDALTC